MDDTAAHVQTITLWPSLKPSVCSMNPREEKVMLMQRPAGAASQDRRPASKNPVRQQAADSPKQAPAYKGTKAREGNNFTITKEHKVVDVPDGTHLHIPSCWSQCNNMHA